MIRILFPEDEVVKAEVIEYYLKIAPTLLNHVKGRALTLIRFPDGINGEMFYQKNRPEWAPDWIEFEVLARKKRTTSLLPSLLVGLACQLSGTRACINFTAENRILIFLITWSSILIHPKFMISKKLFQLHLI
ncbi:MAG: hypothetical protein QM734_12160 [Cyclobacteriaceae bacterium]